MPGRFSHLEFDEERRRSQEQSDLKPMPSARTYLGEAQEAHHVGRFEHALRLYTRCLREDAGLVEAWVGQVRMLVELGELDEARVWSDKALEVFRGNGEILAAKAQSCARLKDYKEACACSDGSMKAPGSSPWRWQVRGEVLLARRERTFQMCFEKALAEPAADWFDRLIIGRICLYYGRAANAIEYLREAMTVQPANQLVWLTLGTCQDRLGMPGAAATSFERALEIDPQSPEAKDALARLESRSFLGSLVNAFRRWSGR